MTVRVQISELVFGLTRGGGGGLVRLVDDPPLKSLKTRPAPTVLVDFHTNLSFFLHNSHHKINANDTVKLFKNCFLFVVFFCLCSTSDLATADLFKVVHKYIARNMNSR